MANYFVRKTGNDSTGDGSTGNPWLTVTKALATISAAGNHVVNVGDGTYNENTTGLNFLYITQAFSAYVTIQAESGILGNVIISSNGAAVYAIRLNGAKFIKFQNIVFTPNVDITEAVVFFQDSNIDHIQLIDCNIIVRSVAAATKYGVRFTTAGTNVVDTILFQNVTVTQTGPDPVDGLRLFPLAGTATFSNVTVRNCTVNVVTRAMIFNGATNFLVDGGSFISSTSISVSCGLDAATGGLATSGVIQNAYIQSISSHALLIGNGSNGVTATGNNVVGGNDGLVVKECANAVVTNNIVNGGTDNALYFKAATACMATGNRVINSVGNCVKCGPGDTANKSGTVTFTHNTVLGSGTSGIYSWADSTGDSGGCVVDYNSYVPIGSAKFGAVRADASVLDLAELRAAWAGYGDGSNDSHSGLYGDDAFGFGLGMGGAEMALFN